MRPDRCPTMARSRSVLVLACSSDGECDAVLFASLISSPDPWTDLLETNKSPQSSPAAAAWRAHGVSDGLIWPKTGSRLDRLNRNDGGKTFFPCRTTPRGRPRGGPGLPAFLARQETLPAVILRSRSGPNGCVADRLRPCDRHRGRGGRGLGSSHGEVTWRISVPSRRSAAMSFRAKS